MKKNYQLTIQGRVQGVGFRYWVKNMADQLQLTGYVRNLPDGAVFAEIQGEEDACTAMIQNCHEGPPLAFVNKVSVAEGIIVDYFGFQIRR